MVCVCLCDLCTGAANHSLCPTPSPGVNTVIRAGEIDIDLRASRPNFDVCMSVSPLNVVVPCTVKPGPSSSASSMAAFRGRVTPLGHGEDPIGVAWPPRASTSDAPVTLQLLASQLQLHVLEARWGCTSPCWLACA